MPLYDMQFVLQHRVHGYTVDTNVYAEEGKTIVEALNKGVLRAYVTHGDIYHDVYDLIAVYTQPSNGEIHRSLRPDVLLKQLKSDYSVVFRAIAKGTRTLASGAEEIGTL